MCFGPVRRADYVLWGRETGCSLIPATSGWALVLRRNGVSWGLAALVIGYLYVWRTVGTLAFAFVLVSGRGEVHLATSSTSVLATRTLSAPRRL